VYRRWVAPASADPLGLVWRRLPVLRDAEARCFG